MDIKDRIAHQFPEFCEVEYPVFMQFVEHYYNFLDSSELVLSGITGTFVNSEGLLVASTFKASEVRGVDSDNSRLFVKTQNRFEVGDVVSGLVSGATGTIVSHTPNPIRSIEELLDYRDIDATVSKYFGNFKAEFMATIPSKLASGIDKRAITKGIVDLYRAKGTSEGHKLFFKMLLDEDVEIYYPSEDLLSPSDGDWSFDTIMRVDKGSISDINVLVGGTVTQRNNPQTTVDKATCKIDSVKTFFNGVKEVLEFSINKDSIRGSFIAGQFVYIIGTDGVEYKYLTTPLIIKISISEPGEYYSETESLRMSGFDYPAICSVETITSGIITGVDILSEGSGYGGDEDLVFNENNTLGQGTEGIISGVHGSIRLEDSEDELILEDHTVWASGNPENKILLSSGTGGVIDTHIKRIGFNYDKLPSISANTSGTPATFYPTTKDVGGISSVRIVDPGFNLTGTPTAIPDTVLSIHSATGSYTTGETVTSSSGGSGDVVKYESDIGILKLKTVTGTFITGDVITGNTTTVTSTVIRNSTATLSIETGVLSSGSGRFISEDGWTSSFAKRIQDNYYYQKFSYLVKAAESIITWRSAVKKAVHPAGFAVFGQINIVSLLNARMKVGTTTTFTPVLYSTFKDIIWTVLRRRLGADGYGSKNLNPEVGGEGNRDLSIHGAYDVEMTHEHLVNWWEPWRFYNHWDGTRGGQTLRNLDKYKFIDPPAGHTHSGTQDYTYSADYYFVWDTIDGTYDYGLITSPAQTGHSDSSNDYGDFTSIAVLEPTKTHDYPGIHRTIATNIGHGSASGPVGTHHLDDTYWVHPDTGWTGVSGGYTIDQFGHYKISDMDTGRLKKTNIPPPSEISVKFNEWLTFTSAPGDTSDLLFFRMPVSDTYTTRTYTSTGLSDTFGVTPLTSYIVHINGVIQPESEYSINSNVLTFNLGVPSGSVVSISETSGTITDREYSGSGNSYTISSGMTGDSVLVYINNVIQKYITEYDGATDYTVSGTTLTTTSSLTSSDTIIIKEFSSILGMKNRTGNGVATLFPSTLNSTTDNSLVYVSGVFQMPTTNYTVA